MMNFTDFFQQLFLNVIQLHPWILGDDPQIMCEEHWGGEAAPSQQPGEFIIHGVAEAKQDHFGLYLRKISNVVMNL